MKLYCYCVTTSDTRTPEDLVGLFDQKVVAVQSREVAALVSVISEEPVVVTKHNAFIHQRVVAAALEHKTPLPFRFGTVITEPQLTSYLGSRQNALIEKLAAVSGCVEMGVKVIWQRSLESSSTETAVSETDIEGVGTAFLRSKSRSVIGNELATEEAEGIRSWLETRVCPYVRDTLFQLRPARRLVLAADCLVESTQLDSYRAAIASATSERPELHFLTSGPWAPYSFANIELEFKTHFGVS